MMSFSTFNQYMNNTQFPEMTLYHIRHYFCVSHLLVLLKLYLTCEISCSQFSPDLKVMLEGLDLDT